MISLKVEENLEVGYERPMSRVIKFDTGINFVMVFLFQHVQKG